MARFTENKFLRTLIAAFSCLFFLIVLIYFRVKYIYNLELYELMHFSKGDLLELYHLILSSYTMWSSKFELIYLLACCGTFLALFFFVLKNRRRYLVYFLPLAGVIILGWGLFSSIQKNDKKLSAEDLRLDLAYFQHREEIRIFRSKESSLDYKNDKHDPKNLDIALIILESVGGKHFIKKNYPKSFSFFSRRKSAFYESDDFNWC